MINNYIFDFGNVIAGYDQDRLTRCHIKDEQRIKILSEVVFDRAYWDRLDDGSYTDDDEKARLRERLDDDLYKDACLVFDNWIENLEKIEGTCFLIDDIKKSGKKLYLLSNISIGFAKSYKKVKWIDDVLSKFDGLVFSGEVKMVKPNAEIFEYILEKYSLDPKECIFIDDTYKNIQGCSAVGIPCYQFDGDADKLRKYLGY